MAEARGIVSPVDTPTMTAYIVIRLAGLQIPFPMPDGLEDVCAQGTAPGTCPVSAGQSFDYTLSFQDEVLSLSGVTVQAEVGITAADGTVIGCLEFDAHLVA